MQKMQMQALWRAEPSCFARPAYFLRARYVRHVRQVETWKHNATRKLDYPKKMCQELGNCTYLEEGGWVVNGDSDGNGKQKEGPTLMEGEREGGVETLARTSKGWRGASTCGDLVYDFVASKPRATPIATPTPAGESFRLSGVTVALSNRDFSEHVLYTSSASIRPGTSPSALSDFR